MTAQKTEIELGWLPAITLDLIPILKIEFDPPLQSVVDGFKNATSPVVEIPISGKCPGVIDGLACEVTWKKKTGEEAEDGTSVTAKIQKTADGVFKIVDERGKNLTVDIFTEKLIGKGTFGYSVKPLLPKHSAVDHFPSGFSFENILDLEMPSVSSLRIGQKIAMKLKRTGIFSHSDVRLLVAENDEGEVENSDAVGVQHTWKQGDDEAWTWTVGFADTGYALLTYPEPDEKGSYEYNFTFLARCNETDTFTEVKRLINYVKDIKKPELTSFKLEYRKDYKVINTLVACGTIKNLASETRLQIGVNLTKNTLPQGKALEVLNEKRCVGETNEAGEFVIPIEWVFWNSKMKNLDDYMAILYLPQLGNQYLHKSQHCAPVWWVIDYDESSFATFDGKKFVCKSDGKWLCSVEAGEIAKNEKSAVLRTSQNGIDFIKKHEGFVSKPYNDSVGHATIGYGTLLHKGGVTKEDNAKYSNGISKEEAEKLLLKKVNEFEPKLNAAVKVPLNQNQFDALMSWTYNFGPYRLDEKKCTWLRELNAGNYDKVPAGLKLWNKGEKNGKKVVLPGLVKRRQDEADLFLKQ